MGPAKLERHVASGPFPLPAGCGTVCVGGRYTAAAVTAYRGTPTRVCTLVDWPAGQAKPTVRQIEAVAAAKDGSNAVEVVAHQPMLSTGDADALRDDLLGIVIAVREVSAAVEVRVAMASIAERDGTRQWAAVCNAVREAGCDGIVCGTGYGGAVAVQDVARLRDAAGPLWLKAWAGRDAALAGRLLVAGADTVGMLSG